MAFPDELAPVSYVGLLHPDQPWSPWLRDGIASNSYSNADGFSFKRLDPRTGKYYTTNQREERERKEENKRWDKYWGQ
jgi:hypothetical protein